MQGVGAALLLAGALPVLGALAGSPADGARVWILAGTFGLALGPALGGVLTQAFSWRAIFVAQAPVAALGLLAVASSHVRTVAEEGWRPSLRRTLPANVSLGLLFGALVGALFLAVLLVISVWNYSPIAGAAIVSVLPAAALVARPLERRLPRLVAVCGGAALLAGGLVGLALLPSASVGFAVWALALCGAGLGLAVPVLSDAVLDPGSELTRSGTLTVGARHVGLVLAIAVIAPLLASKVPAAGDEAMLKATAVLLDAPVGLDKKVPVALVAPRRVRPRAGGGDPGPRAAVQRARRAHRLLARRDPRPAARDDRGHDHARLALGVLRLRAVRGRGAAGGRRLPPEDRLVTRRLTPALWILVALLASGLALVAAELGSGALNEPSPKIANPCEPRPGRTGGIDTTIQRVVLDGLDGAACRLHTTREELVLSIGGDSLAPRHWDQHTIDVALRAGLLGAVNRAEQRGDIPSFLVPLIRTAIDKIPLEKLIRGGISLQDLLG